MTGGNPTSVLLLQQDSEVALRVEECLQQSNLEAHLRQAPSLDAGVSALQEFSPDVIVGDLDLPGSSKTETFQTISATAPEVPTVVLTDSEKRTAALETQKAEATEHLRKEELSPALLGRTVQWAAERKKMQTKLQRQDTWIQSITQNTSDGVFRYIPGQGIDYANDVFAQMLGADTPDSLLGRELAELGATPQAKATLQAFQDGNTEPDGHQVQLSLKKENVVTARLHGRIVQDKQQGLAYRDGLITDIVHQPEPCQPSNETTSSYESLVKDVFNKAPVGVFVLDSDFRVVWVNEATETFFGLDREEIIGADKQRLIENQIQQTLEAPEEFADTVTATYRDNTYVEQFECHVLPGEHRKERWLEHQSRPVEYGRHAGGRVEFYWDITEQKDREQKLQVLSKAIDQANEAILITKEPPVDEPSPEIVYANEAFEKMTGYTESELLGATPPLFQETEAPAKVLESLQEALQAGREWRGETINYRKNGAPYRAQWNLAPVRGEEGNIDYWVSAQRDVTGKRKREERLQLLARALEQVGDKVMITDPQGQIEKVNEAFEAITGYSEDEVLGKTPKILQSGVQDEEFYEELWSTLLSGTTFRAEFTNKRKDGTHYVEDERISPIRNEAGRITHFVSAGRDVTDRRRKEENLRKERDRRTALFENASDPIIEIRFENNLPIIRDTNLAFESTFGIGDQEALGLTVSEAIVPESGQEKHEHLQEQVFRGERVEAEVRRETKEGVREFLVQVIPMNVEGRTQGAYAWYIDITERKRREEALKRAKQEAEEAAQLKSAMMANMSHEIRTPLTSITGFAELLEERLDGELKSFSRRIRQSGKRLMDTLDSVLQLSELEAGAEKLEREAVRLNEIARETGERFSASAAEKSISLQLEIPSTPVEGRWNEDAVTRILENLLENAIKFTPEGGTVTIRAWSEDGNGILEVEDTGIGISEEALPGVFAPFRQESEGLDRRYEGTGLGLPIVRRLAEALGGTVEAFSENGDGSRFVVHLPGEDHQGPDTAPQEESVDADSSPSAEVSSETLAVREDESLDQRLAAPAPGKSVFRRMATIMADREASFEEKTARLLELGRTYLDLPYGFVAKVSGDTTKIVSVSGPSRLVTRGETYPLSEVYCGRTVRDEKPVTTRHAPLSERDMFARQVPSTEQGNAQSAKSPDFASYIGAKVLVHGDIYGTFCFGAPQPRAHPFREREKTFVRLMARWTSFKIERRQAKAQLERQNERLEHFSSVLTHDLRNPLNVAQGRLSLALEEIDGNAATKAPEETGMLPDHLHAASRGLERMERLITDMLALTWSEQDFGTEEMKDLSLEEIAADSWEQIEAAETTLQIDAPVRLSAHEGRLKQLLENLFRNAIDHGGPDVTVRMGSFAEGFFVEDDGPGIPTERHEKVFERGYSSDEQGTGLGLSIVEAIAEAHEWTVSLTDGRDGGARFEIKGVNLTHAAVDTTEAPTG